MSNQVEDAVFATDALELIGAAIQAYDGPPLMLGISLLRVGFSTVQKVMSPADFRRAAAVSAVREMSRPPTATLAAQDQGVRLDHATDVVCAMIDAWVAAGGLAADLVPVMLLEAASRLRRAHGDPAAFEEAMRVVLADVERHHSGDRVN